MKKLFTLIVILFASVIHIVFAQNVNIPDANFKAVLVANAAINTNSDGEIQESEAAAYKGYIDASNKHIAFLIGIEAFTNLTKLSCGTNQLTSLDVSKTLS